jgi:hypothetical protein
MMKRAIYYALMLFVALLTVIVTAAAIQSAIAGDPIAFLLIPIIVLFVVLLYRDGLEIINEGRM